MLQRFASALFGDNMEELSQCSKPGDGKEEEDEEDEDWILVNYLSEACSHPCGDSLSESTVGPEEDEEEEEEEGDLVMIPSPMASPRIRYASCTSLNSMADTDPDGGAEEDENSEDKEENGFLHLDARSLEESWFITPPPCFTGCGSQPVLLETSPLENLLIEHPSMSVYARHGLRRLTLEPLPRSLDLELDLSSENVPNTPTSPGGKEKARRTLDSPRHRQEVGQRRSNLHSTCYAAAFSTPTSFLQQRTANAAQRAQLLSRNNLRRLNLLYSQKASTVHLHQPSQRQLNF